MTCSFGDRQYWDDRYSKNEAEFDWLLPASSLDAAILGALQGSSHRAPRILHLGCGTSSLSFHLRGLVHGPEQVHNVDFSGPCIIAGRAKEREYFLDGRLGNGKDEVDSMEWSVIDLLSTDQITKLATGPGRNHPYDVVVDKSTSDSISCGEDLPVPPPSLIRGVDFSLDSYSNAVSVETMIHPMDLLAVHLAYLTPPGAHWVALSYSKERFSAWFGAKPEIRIQREGIHIPSPSELWELKAMEGIPVKENDGAVEGAVHRPEILHYLFVLVRTHVGLVGAMNAGPVTSPVG